MKRTRWILLGIATLLAIGALSWSNAERSTPPETVTRARPDRARATARAERNRDEGRARRTEPHHAPPRAADDDVPMSREPDTPTYTATTASTAGATPSDDDPGASSKEPAEEHSAGWRLGRARRRIVILEERTERIGAIVDRLEAEGRTDLAERQRAVLDRTLRRMKEERADEPILTAAAEADGTLDDVEAGYEGETDPLSRRVARAQRPTP